MDIKELEKIEQLIRDNGKYRERFTVGLLDMVDVHVKPLAKAVAVMIIEAEIKAIKKCLIDKFKTKISVKTEEAKYFKLGVDRAIYHANTEFNKMIADLEQQKKSINETR